MRKSPESVKLEEYTRSLPGAYDDFVLAMSFIPQRKGIDKELWAYVEENEPDINELGCQCAILSGHYRGDMNAKELAASFKEGRWS